MVVIRLATAMAGQLHGEGSALLTTSGPFDSSSVGDDIGVGTGWRRTGGGVNIGGGGDASAASNSIGGLVDGFRSAPAGIAVADGSLGSVPDSADRRMSIVRSAVRSMSSMLLIAARAAVWSSPPWAGCFNAAHVRAIVRKIGNTIVEWNCGFHPTPIISGSTRSAARAAIATATLLGCCSNQRDALLLSKRSSSPLARPRPVRVISLLTKSRLVCRRKSAIGTQHNDLSTIILVL
jgi:hypothetical protein